MHWRTQLYLLMITSIFSPCTFVRHFPVRHFPVLHFQSPPQPTKWRSLYDVNDWFWCNSLPSRYRLYPGFRWSAPAAWILGPETVTSDVKTEGSAFLSSCFVTGRPSKYQTDRVKVGHLPKQVFRVGNDKLLFSNIADVTITCYDVNTTVVMTARPTGRQFVVQFQCGCDVAAGDVLWDNYSLTETLRRVWHFRAQWPLIGGPHRIIWRWSTGRWLVVCPVG